MYGASLRTEEGQPITFQICYIDPATPDPDPPPRIRRYRWQSFGFADRIPFTNANVTKLAKASDPRTSALAVFAAGAELFVWGLIDQGNLYFEHLNREAEQVHAYRPGFFQASIDGPAQITVWVDRERIGELRGTTLAGAEVDALADGPLRAALQPGIDAFRADVVDGLAEGGIEPEEDWENLVRRSWIRELCRILIRTQIYRHGGSLLLTPETRDGLKVKYELNYPRIRDSLIHAAVAQLARGYYWDAIHDLLEGESSQIPALLHLSHEVAENELEDGRIEQAGVAWFVSLLTRVDGLVLLSPHLDVEGFGVEITIAEEPSSVALASDPMAQQLTPLDPQHYGTRHRSMMRYCASVSGSVGFVVSQDGDVRAMTLVNDLLVMWDQLKVRQYEFPDPEAEESRPWSDS